MDRGSSLLRGERGRGWSIGGDGNRDKYPWTTQENAAAWTIDILMHGRGCRLEMEAFSRFGRE